MSYQRERNWFIEQLQHVAKDKHVRISFLSGDVHCAAVGLLKTLVKGKKEQDVPPAMDHRYMLNVVTSTYRIHMALTSSIVLMSMEGAIVNTP